MLRALLTTICTVEVLAPDRLVNWAESLALDNPQECERKSWVIPGARVEGLLFLGLLWRSETSYSLFKKFLGLIGLVALLSPRRYVHYGAALAYENAPNCEWKPWVYAGTRVIGLLYVLIAIDALRD